MAEEKNETDLMIAEMRVEEAEVRTEAQINAQREKAHLDHVAKREKTHMDAKSKEKHNRERE